MEKEKVKVLVVEDEHIILKYIAQKLKDADPDVEIIGLAEDVPAAMEIMRANPPDILFTDIEMPGMDGIELIGWAKKHFKDMHVVVISGYSNFDYAKAALRYGVFDYLLKPIEKETLGQVLHEIKQLIFAERKLEEQGSRAQQGAAVKELEIAEEPDLAQSIRQYIELYFNKPISVAQLSEQFNYSQVYLTRIFRQEFGLAPMKYQTQVRIEKAKQLLENHKMADIKDIAAAVGYDDARYFSRVFKQMVGVSPSEYVREKGKTAGR